MLFLPTIIVETKSKISATIYFSLFEKLIRKNKNAQDDAQDNAQDSALDMHKTQDKGTQDKKTQDKRNETFNKIIEICKEPKSIKEIMEELGFKSNKTFKRSYIKPLLESRKLKMTIPEKPTSRNQKYISNK